MAAQLARFPSVFTASDGAHLFYAGAVISSWHELTNSVARLCWCTDIVHHQAYLD